MLKLVTFLAFLCAFTQAQDTFTTTYCKSEKNVIVHLFDWSWNDVAMECESFLGRLGYCGVQVSPPMEHIQGTEWWTRYQPVSYKLDSSRSGNSAQFDAMVSKCNAAGVNVYVDLVINHMTGQGKGTGTAGDSYNGDHNDAVNGLQYPGVPYGPNDFHQPYCDITNYQDPDNVRYCALSGLNDLNGGSTYVQGKILDYINDLVSRGVTGFRIDAAKHMYPNDIVNTISRVNNNLWGGKPTFYLEVIDKGGEPITSGEYAGYDIGRVTEFKACPKFDCLIGGTVAGCLNNYDSGLLGFHDAITFVDNHDTQRNHGGGQGINFNFGNRYKLGVAWHLTHYYSGMKRVMSSYDFYALYGGNTDAGPPAGSPGNSSGVCQNGWVCEHRWAPIANLVKLSGEFTRDSDLMEEYNVWDNGFSWSRYSPTTRARAHVVAGFDSRDIDGYTFSTTVADGVYCDLISKDVMSGACRQTLVVSGGILTVKVYQVDDPIVAICEIGYCGE